MATPALAALRRHWPRARITAAGPAHAEALLEGNDDVDEVVALPPRGPLGVARAARRLRGRGIDAAILLTNSFSSALAVALAGVPRRVGYVGGGRGALLTDRCRHPREAGRHRLPTPMVDYYFRLLEHVGVPRGDHHYRLATTARDEERAAAWLADAGLDDGRPLFGIHPGSSYGPSKLWTTAGFAAVADALATRWGARVVVLCGPGERDLARSIAAAASSGPATTAEAPVDLGTLKALVRRMDLLVATDTGPRHFGPAFDVPTVVVMGSTDPRFTNTNLARSRIVRTGVSCSPCQLKVCPIDHRCMTWLTPERVLAAVAGLLGAGEPSGGRRPPGR